MNKVLVEIIVIVCVICSIIACVKNFYDEESSENYNNESSQSSQNVLEKGLDDVKVEVEEESTWENSNQRFSTVKIKIKNDTDKNIGDWTLVILTDNEIELDETWNGNWKVEDKKISVTGLEYNLTISANKEIDLGGILKYNENKLKILDYQLYSDNIEIETQKQNTNFSNEEREIKEFSKIDVAKNSPLQEHGKLSLDGQNIVDKNGNKFQIQGISTHSISAFPEYINLNVFKFIKNTLNANTIRLCVYTIPEEGYTTDLFSKIDEGIEYATQEGLYVILDWHTLTDYDPNINIESAKEFFSRMVDKYKDYDNVIYEICNEPNGAVTWDSVKSYALEIIPIIREKSPESLIIVGTPNYCKNLSDVQNNSIEEYENILYSLHFYASSHGQFLRDTLEDAYNNSLPIIVSEYGLSEYTGTGSLDENEANIWIDYLREKSIGYICWSFTNKDETSALLKTETENVDELTEENLSQAGLWIKNKYNE